MHQKHSPHSHRSQTVKNTILTLRKTLSSMLWAHIDHTLPDSSLDWDSCLWWRMCFGPVTLSSLSPWKGPCSLSLEDLCLLHTVLPSSCYSLLRLKLHSLFLEEACPDPQPSQMLPFTLFRIPCTLLGKRHNCPFISMVT